jgi:hypothetical protein
MLADQVGPGSAWLEKRIFLNPQNYIFAKIYTENILTALQPPSASYFGHGSFHVRHQRPAILAASARKPALLFAVPSAPAGIAWVAGFDAGDAGPLESCRAGRRKISGAAICYISMHASWKRYPYSWPTLAFCAASQDSEPRMSVDGLMSTHNCPPTPVRSMAASS